MTKIEVFIEGAEITTECYNGVDKQYRECEWVRCEIRQEDLSVTLNLTLSTVVDIVGLLEMAMEGSAFRDSETGEEE